ncbi:hypothetical protein BG000_003869 [Podila horticola]|nr:hypothetical protein BG000_003869 [Podila horticola]
MTPVVSIDFLGSNGASAVEQMAKVKARIKNKMSIISSTKALFSSASSENPYLPSLNASFENSPRHWSLEQVALAKLSGSHKSSTLKTSFMAHTISRI